jgi:hypothetical protein
MQTNEQINQRTNDSPPQYSFCTILTYMLINLNSKNNREGWQHNCNTDKHINNLNKN